MKQLDQTSRREQVILEIIGRFQKAGTADALHELELRFGKISRATVIRDLNTLVKKKMLKRSGKGRGVLYETLLPSLLNTFEAESYFSIEPDKRAIKKERIDFTKVMAWVGLFDDQEKQAIDELTSSYRERKKKYNKTMLQKELERITIEFSWRSSHIEGNTYTLLDTERLLKEQEEAPGKKHDEAVMIVNHKKALEYAWRHAQSFKKISPHIIREFHDLIVKYLGITRGLRTHPVGIVGTAYLPHDNVHQIREMLSDLCSLVNAIKDPFTKALAVVSGLSYIQPFEDGNKRTSRLLGNAILLAHDYCPLSYRSIDETEYKKAIILFYEQHTLFLFKRIFLEQYQFASSHYFL